MLRLPINLFCLLLPLASIAADEPQGRSIPYQKLYAPLAAVKQADPAGIVSSTLRAEPVQPDQPLPLNLKIELRAGKTPQSLMIDSDGVFKLPMRADWASSDASVWVSVPKDAVKIVEIFKMRTPKQTHLSYGTLMESVPVLERIQQQHLAIVGIMATPPNGVELAYTPGTPQTVTIGVGAKAKALSTDERGHVQIPFDPALPATTPVVLSAPPEQLQPYSN